MARTNRWWGWTFSLGLCTLLLGCPSAPPPAATESGATEPASTGASATAPPAVAEMAELEPFTPPTFEELDAKANWFSQPVEDAMELLLDFCHAHVSDRAARHW